MPRDRHAGRGMFSPEIHLPFTPSVLRLPRGQPVRDATGHLIPLHLSSQMNARIPLLPAVIVVTCIGCSRQSLVEAGSPLPGLTVAELEQFERGREVFTRTFKPEEGLGPVYNANTCNACHSDPGPGGGSMYSDVHAVRWVEPDSCDVLSGAGGGFVRREGTELMRAHGFQPERAPSNATAISDFTPPLLYGVGLIEAIPDDSILQREDPEDVDSDGISGRAGRYPDGRLARFRRKADVPTLAEAVEAAVRMEMGLTNPVNLTEGFYQGKIVPPETDPTPEPEISLKEMEDIANFLRLLAAPAPRIRSTWGERRVVSLGEKIFEEIGCAACHTQTLWTGPSDIRALDQKPVRLYSDLLLHDMGPEMADVCGPTATPAELRTQMLWGMRYRERYMHDGRAQNLAEAIALHDGESAASRTAFNDLAPREQAMLIMFLDNL